jgi:membrane-associated phospholipid phosphatase
VSDTPRHGHGRTRLLYALGTCIALGTVGVILCHLLLDERVVQWLLHHPQKWHRDTLVNAFRQLGKAYVPIWLLLVWSLVTNRWRPTVTVCLALILTSATVCSLKALARRERPNERLARIAAAAAAEPESPRRWGVSFPSGDTAVVFATATVLTSMTHWAWGPVLFAGAGAVGVLRISSLVHYPSDVLAGVFLGILAGWYAPRLVRHRWPRKLLEGLHELTERQRLVLGLLLAFVVPLLSPFLGMRPLLVFLRAYALPAALVILAAAWLSRGRPLLPEQAARDPEKTP